MFSADTTNRPDETTPDANGIKVAAIFELSPDALGPQHDAREPGYGEANQVCKTLRQVDRRRIAPVCL